MIRIIIILLTSLLSLLVNAQAIQQKLPVSEAGITIKVRIQNISTNKGKVYFSLFNSKESFHEKKSFAIAIGEIKENNTEISFQNIPKGIYAITCFHDANDNKKMDFDGFMPLEDYGVSNNPRSMGPPQFEPAKFEVGETDLEIEIKF